MLAQNIDALITVTAGAFCTYVAYSGVPVGSQKPHEWQQWHARWGRLLKWIGPLLIAMGLLRVLLRF